MHYTLVQAVPIEQVRREYHDIERIQNCTYWTGKFGK